MSPDACICSMNEGVGRYHLAFGIVVQAVEKTSCYLSIVQTSSSPDTCFLVYNSLDEVEVASDLPTLPNVVLSVG